MVTKRKVFLQKCVPIIKLDPRIYTYIVFNQIRPIFTNLFFVATLLSGKQQPLLLMKRGVPLFHQTILLFILETSLHMDKISIKLYKKVKHKTLSSLKQAIISDIYMTYIK